MSSIGLKIAQIAATLAFTLTALGCPAQETSREFYVDCSGSQAGDGLLQTPWNNLASVNAITLQPGDTVHFRRGTLCHGSLSPKGSGADQKPIRFTAYGEGPRPKVVADSKPRKLCGYSINNIGRLIHSTLPAALRTESSSAEI